MLFVTPTSTPWTDMTPRDFFHGTTFFLLQSFLLFSHFKGALFFAEQKKLWQLFESLWRAKLYANINVALTLVGKKVNFFYVTGNLIKSELCNVYSFLSWVALNSNGVLVERNVNFLLWLHFGYFADCSRKCTVNSCAINSILIFFQFWKFWVFAFSRFSRFDFPNFWFFGFRYYFRFFDFLM